MCLGVVMQIRFSYKIVRNVRCERLFEKRTVRCDFWEIFGKNDKNTRKIHNFCVKFIDKIQKNVIINLKILKFIKGIL